MASTGSPTVDVLIIGGGPAGLSTALSLSRLRLTAVLFDSGLYRNAATDYIHNISTWDHQDPTTYRPVARAELTNGRYKTVGFANMAIVSVPKDETGSFKAVDATGKEWTVK